MRNTFKGRTVIITGASSGTGKALALQLADEGAWLALTARNAQCLDPLAEECRQREGSALAIPTDGTESWLPSDYCGGPRSPLWVVAPVPDLAQHPLVCCILHISSSSKLTLHGTGVTRHLHIPMTGYLLTSPAAFYLHRALPISERNA